MWRSDRDKGKWRGIYAVEREKEATFPLFFSFSLHHFQALYCSRIKITFTMIIILTLIFFYVVLLMDDSVSYVSPAYIKGSFSFLFFTDMPSLISASNSWVIIHLIHPAPFFFFILFVKTLFRAGLCPTLGSRSRGKKKKKNHLTRSLTFSVCLLFVWTASSISQA